MSEPRKEVPWGEEIDVPFTITTRGEIVDLWSRPERKRRRRVAARLMYHGLRRCSLRHPRESVALLRACWQEGRKIRHGWAS